MSVLSTGEPWPSTQRLKWWTNVFGPVESWFLDFAADTCHEPCLSLYNHVDQAERQMLALRSLPPSAPPNALRPTNQAPVTMALSPGTKRHRNEKRDENRRSRLADAGRKNGDDLFSLWKKVGSTESTMLVTWEDSTPPSHKAVLAGVTEKNMVEEKQIQTPRAHAPAAFALRLYGAASRVRHDGFLLGQQGHSRPPPTRKRARPIGTRRGV